jgi:hypothetical protein
MAIEAQDAHLQVRANKKIAALALENANLQMKKKQKPVEQEKPVQLSDGGRLPEQTPRHYQKLIRKLKIGLQKIDGSEPIEL